MRFLVQVVVNVIVTMVVIYLIKRLTEKVQIPVLSQIAAGV